MGWKKSWLSAAVFMLLFATPYALNTSIYGARFHPHDFNFSSSSYALANTFQFNTSASNTQFAFMHTQNLQKISGGATISAYRRVSVDGVVKSDELAGSLSNIGDVVSVGTTPFLFNVSAGVHNITVEWRRVGTGTIEVKNIDSNIIRFVSANGSPVRNEFVNRTYSFSSASFIQAFNWSINKTVNSSTFIEAKMVLNTTVAADADHYILDTDDSTKSAFWKRHMSSSSDFGFAGGGYVEPSDAGNHTHTLMARVSSGGITVNATVIDFDLADNASNLINHFEVGRNDTNLTNNVSFGAGTQNILNASVTSYNGTSYFLAMSAAIGSTSGAQLPTFKINSSELPESSCRSYKERNLKGSTDTATVYVYAICENLTVGNNYTFNVWATVEPGETMVLFDESLGGFELTPFDTATINTPPLPEDITSPQNASYVGGVLNVTWPAFTDPQGDPVTYNISLYSAGGAYNRTINTTNSTWQLFNTSAVADGGWYVYVIGCDNSSNCSNSSVFITVDNTAPSVSVNSPAGGTFISSRAISINATSTDTNLNYTNISVVSAGVLANSTINSTNGTYVAQLAVLADGFYNITATAYDLAGNTNSSTSANVGVDTAAPAISIYIPANSTYNTSTVALSYSASDAVSGVGTCWYSLDGGSNFSLPGCTNYSIGPMEEGSHFLVIYANDTLGHIGSANVTFNIDTTQTMVDSLYGVRFQTANVSFASSTYVLGFAEYFNTSAPNTELVLFTSASLVKTSGPGSNDVWRRIKVDGVTVQEGSIRVLTARNEEVTRACPILKFNVSTGEHNLTFEYNRSGSGTILIHDIDLNLVQMRTTGGGTVRNQFNFTQSWHNSTSFVPIYNTTINRSGGLSPTYALANIASNVSAATVNATYFFSGPTNSTYSMRAFTSTNLLRTVLSYVDTSLSPTHNMSIMARSSGGYISIMRLSVFDMDLRDNNSRFIRYFQASNNLTNYTNTSTFSGGTFNLLNTTVKVYNGTSYLMTAIATFASTSGAQTVRVFANSSSVSQSTCFTQKNRTITSNTDVTQTAFYFLCQNLTPGNSYTFNLYIQVPAGETVRVQDESLDGFELTPFDVASTNLPPLPNQITNPDEGTAHGGMLNITWAPFSDPNGNNITYNVSVLYANGTLASLLNSSITANFQLFNTSTVADGNYSANVEGCDNTSLCANSTLNFTVDNSVPQASFVPPTEQNATSLSRTANNAPYYAYVTSVYVPIFNSISGNVTETTLVDGVRWDISESRLNESNSSQPVMDIYMNFTNIPSQIANLSLNLYGLYNGSPACNIDVLVWNYSAGNWSQIGHITNGNADSWMNYSSASAGMAQNGVVQARIVHQPLGIAEHYLSLDYISLSGSVNGSWAYINATGTDATTPLSQCILDWNGSNESIPRSGGMCYINKTGFSSGAYSYRVYVLDGAGNSNDTGTRILFVDSSAPLLSVQSPAQQVYNVSNVSISFAASDPISGINSSACKYSLDGAANVSLPGCANTSLLVGDAAHNISIFVMDNAGNLNSSNVKFTVDTLAPIVSLVAPTDGNFSNVSRGWVYVNATAVDALTNVSSCLLEWNGTNETMAKVGTAGSASCWKNKTGLADGSYSFRVFANDSAGNFNVSQPRMAVVDTAAPPLSILSPSNVTYNISTLDFNFTVSDSVSGVDECWYSLDASANASLPGCANTSLATLSQGPHSVVVYSNDSAGNTNSTGVFFFVDSLSPVLDYSAQSTDSGVYRNRSWAYIEINYTEANRLNTTLDMNGTAHEMQCNSTHCWHNVTSLADGYYMYNATMNDSAGNRGRTGNRNLTVDTAAPSVSILSPSNGSALTIRTFAINLTVSDANLNYTSISIYNSSGTVNSTTSASSGNFLVQLVVPADGIYDVTAISYDLAGNSNSASSYNVIVDSSPPALSYSARSESPGVYSNRSWAYIEVNYTEDDRENTTLSLNGTNYEMQCNSTFCWLNSTSLADGFYLYNVTMNDSAGNRGRTGNRNLTIDTSIPQVAINSPASGSAQPILTLSINVTVGGPNINYTNISVFNSTAQVNSTSTVSTGNFLAQLVVPSDGIYNITATTVDLSGNSNSSLAANILVDSLPPSPAFSQGSEAAGAFLNRGWAYVIVNYTEANRANTSLNMNGTINEMACNSTACWLNSTSLADGFYLYNVTMNDSAGNRGRTGNRNLTIDTAAPSVSVVSPSNATYNSTAIALNFTVSDPRLGSCWYSLNGGAAVSLPGCMNTSINASAGSNSLSVSANDSAGNANSSSVNFTALYAAAIDLRALMLDYNGYPQSGNTTYLGVPLGDIFMDQFYPAINYTYDNGTPIAGASVNESFASHIGIAYIYDGFTPPHIHNHTHDNGTMPLAGSSLLAVNFSGIYNATPASYMGLSMVVCKNSTSVGPLEVRFGRQLNWSAGTWAINFSESQISVCPSETFVHDDNITALVDAGDIYMMGGCPTCAATDAYIISRVNNTGGSFVANRSLQAPTGDGSWQLLSGSSQNYELTVSLNRYFANFGDFNFAYNSTQGEYVDDSRMYVIEEDSTANASGSASRAGHAPLSRSEIFVNQQAGPHVSIDSIDNGGAHLLPANRTTFEYGTLVLHWSAFHPGGINYSYSNLTNSSGATLEYNDTAYEVAWNVSLFAPLGGQYSVRVFANSSAGNESWEDLVFFVNDTIAPNVSIQSPQDLSYNSSALDLNFTASDGGTGVDSCWYSLDSGANTSLPGCANTAISPGDGQHNLTVYSNDSAGNTGSASVTFLDDLEAPSLTVESPANTTYGSLIIPFNYSVSDVNLDSCWYSLNGGNNTTILDCANITLSGFGQGQHLLAAYANDTLGQVNSSTVYFVIDTVPPNVTVQSPASGNYNISTIDLNFTALDPAGISSCWYSLDSGANTPLPGCANTSLLVGDGAHTIIVYSNDTAGNTNSASASLLVDTAFPSLTVESPANTTYGSLIIPFNYSVSDVNLDSCWYSLNGGNNTTILDCANITLSGFGQGQHLLAAYANDTLSQVNSSTVYFVIDTVPPNMSIQSPLARAYNVSGVDMNFTVSDNISGIDSCWYAINGSANTTLAACANTTLTPGEGNHTVSLYSNDSAGNTGLAQVTFRMDTEAPSLSIIYPTNATLNSTSPVLNFTVEDNTIGVNSSSCHYSLDSGNVTLLPGCANISLPMADGSHKIEMWASDDAGNRNDTSVYFYLDAHAPAVEIQSPQNATYTSRNVSLNLTVSDSASGLNLSSCEYVLDNATESLANCSNITLVNLTYATHTLVVRVRDNAGNLGRASARFTISAGSPGGGGGAECSYVWACTIWSPAICPQEGTQSRICTNSGTCIGSEGMPSLERSCVPPFIPPANVSNETNVTPPANETAPYIPAELTLEQGASLGTGVYGLLAVVPGGNASANLLSVECVPPGTYPISEAIHYRCFSLNTTPAAHNATIRFKVDKKWLLANNVPPGQIYLYRFNSGSWARLPTSLIGDDADYYYFEALTPGFSYFTIAGIAAPRIPQTCLTEGCAVGYACKPSGGTYACVKISEPVQPPPVQPPVQPKEDNTPLCVGGAILALLAAGAGYYVYKNRGKKGK